MATIFKINGGGQRIRQNIQFGLPIEVITVENSDYPEKSKADGCDSYTNEIWATNLDWVQNWANDWAGKEVELTIS